MPYKSKERRRQYAKQWFQRKRKSLISLLGGKCVVCGEDDYAELEIHDIKPVCSRSRPSKKYFDPRGKEVRCKVHHEHTESWRRKRRKR